MKNQSTNIFVHSLKALLKSAFRVTMLTISAILSVLGMFLSKTAETIQRIIIKNS